MLAIAVLSSALGACEGEDVLVGTARDSLNLDVCMGGQTSCEPALSTATLAIPALRSCDAEIGPLLVPDYSLEIALPMCAERESCSASTYGLTVTPDGVSWVYGETSISVGVGMNEPWLLRIGPDGELLGSVDPLHGMMPPPENSVRRKIAMAADERGHVFVLAYEMDAGPNADSPLVERTWLTEYGADGSVVNGPSLITGIGMPHLAIAGDTLVIAANGQKNAPYGVLAALEKQGELLWSQIGVRTDGQGVAYGVVGLAASSNDAFVLAQRSRGGPTNDDVLYGLMRFDDEGNALWDGVLDRPLQLASLFRAGDHHVLIGGRMIDGMSWIGRADEDGEMDWAYGLETWAHDYGGNDALAVDVDRGVALAAGGREMQPELIELSLDGERCARHALRDSFWNGAHVALDAMGGVYLLDSNTLTRVRLPEE